MPKEVDGRGVIGADEPAAWPELDQIAAAVATVLDVSIVLISLVDEDRQVFKGAFGLPRRLADLRSCDAMPLCREVITSARPVIVHDVRRRSRGLAVDGELSIASYAGVPLITSDGICWGALGAMTGERRAWQDRDVIVLRAFAEAAIAIIERRAAARHDRDLHDDLTGLLNRRGFYAIADGQLALAKRQRLPGLVFYLDLDGLKRANDAHGHAAGDALLRAAATALRATFRAADTIARIGGDEFVVFTFDAVELDVELMAKRLADSVASANLDRDQDTPLAWSVGVLSFDAEHAVGIEALVVEADRRMYEAKRLRR